MHGGAKGNDSKFYLLLYHVIMYGMHFYLCIVALLKTATKEATPSLDIFHQVE